MRVDKISNVGNTNINNGRKDQSRFDDFKKLSDAYNESSRFMDKTDTTPEDAKRQREFRKKLGQQAFQALLDGELDKYKK